MLKKILQRFHLSTDPPSQLALHLGSSTLALAELSTGRISHCQQYSYQQGQLANELSRLLTGVSKQTQLQLILAPEFYQVVQLDKPALTDAEMLQALPWQIKDLVSIAPEDIIADYIDLPGSGNSAAKINAVAASAAGLQQLLKPIHEAGINLTAIMPEEWLAGRLVTAGTQATMLVIHQPEQEVLIQIVRNGELYFSRRTRGFSRLHLASAGELADGTLDRLQLELQRSMDYFESQLKQPPVRDIFLLMSEADSMCELFRQSGFSRVQPLPLPAIANTLSSEKLLHCWPAVTALTGIAQESQQ
ncbi:hypothetical protein [Rheinheimera nanhaiensis]|uniref:MSHA biogenesis protein MshI n=1 Tax=Rheinheimera nanhaiensis E407-8 TaxID=562729 RepID=I1DWA1_9GAMM|nr:hypothetical protein [Rheinheimera nanhaiensis]GAB58329.1 hypothetical protein RNAN_1301 [Rheinheimera nanhaiensis E407-8]